MLRRGGGAPDSTSSVRQRGLIPRNGARYWKWIGLNSCPSLLTFERNIFVLMALNCGAYLYRRLAELGLLVREDAFLGAG